MATLKEAIQQKINTLVAEAAALTKDYNETQARIQAAIAKEEARLEHLTLFLDQELGKAKEELLGIFAGYEPAKPDTTPSDTKPDPKK